MSEYILAELAETSGEDLGLSRHFATLSRRAVTRMAKVVELPPSIGRYVPGDPDDDPIIQTALAAKADYVVTADTEVLRVGKVRDVEILTADQFEGRLGPEG